MDINNNVNYDAVDERIRSIIKRLNRLGVKTIASCEGHPIIEGNEIILGGSEPYISYVRDSKGLEMEKRLVLAGWSVSAMTGDDKHIRLIPGEKTHEEDTYKNVCLEFYIDYPFAKEELWERTEQIIDEWEQFYDDRAGHEKYIKTADNHIKSLPTDELVVIEAGNIYQSVETQDRWVESLQKIYPNADVIILLHRSAIVIVNSESNNKVDMYFHACPLFFGKEINEQTLQKTPNLAHPRKITYDGDRQGPNAFIEGIALMLYSKLERCPLCGKKRINPNHRYRDEIEVDGKIIEICDKCADNREII